MAELPVDNVPVRKPALILSTADRKAAYHMLLAMSEDGALPKGSIVAVAAVFSVDRSTISRLWKQVRQKRLITQDDEENDENDHSIYASDAYKRRYGKYVHDREALKEAVKDVPKSRRKRYRWLAANLGILLSTLHYLTKQQKIFRRVSAPVKPTLTVENRIWRVDHAISKIDPATINNPHNPTMRFSNMYNEIHVDEKRVLHHCCR